MERLVDLENQIEDGNLVASKWNPIRTEDDLPKTDSYYICYTSATGSCNGVLSLGLKTATVRGNKVRRWYWNNRISPWQVFAWMPMPEPPAKKKYLVISNIAWKTDGVNPEALDLPDTIEIEIDQENDYLLEDADGYSDEVCEYISNTYGYCVAGFATDVIEAI